MDLKPNWPADLQLSQLQLFVRLAEAGNLSAAARQLQITPAAASAGLKRLESLLAVRLVERSTRSMRLTPEGELLREHAERALGVLDDVRSLLGAQRERLEGEVHVAAPSDLGREVVVPMLDGLLARHPGLRLVMHVSDGMHDLLRDRVDIAVRYGELNDSGLVARRLFLTHSTLVASPAYVAAHGAPQHPSELARHNCLVLSRQGRSQPQWTLRRAGGGGNGGSEGGSEGSESLTVTVQGNRWADDGWVVRLWAVQGLGVALKSRLDVLADLQAGRLVELMPQWWGPVYPLHAILPAQRHLPLRVRRVLDELIAQFARFDGAPPGGAQAASASPPGVSPATEPGDDNTPLH